MPCLLDLGILIRNFQRTLDAEQGGMAYAASGLHGSDDAMHFWDGTKFSCCASDEQSFYKRDAGRQYYGPHPDDQHHAVWHVPVALKSDGCGCHGGGTGRTHPDALHSGDSRALDCGSANGSPCQLPHSGNVSELMCIWGGVITF